jgi:uncharacterized protein (TIGR03067 family)
MRTRFLILTAALSAVSFSWITTFAGSPEAIAAASDLGRLQGCWTARAGARKEIRVILTVRGRQVDVAISTPQGVRVQAQGVVKLDEATSPRQVDWINFTSADQQEFPKIPGIYKLDGDTFTVCNGGMNGSRPKEFKPGDGVLSEVAVFQRERVASTAKTKPEGTTTK